MECDRTAPTYWINNLIAFTDVLKKKSTMLEMNSFNNYLLFKPKLNYTNGQNIKLKT